jgi:hypothetical protein
MPTGPAGDYITAMMTSHYMLPISALQIIGGALLLANRYVPLALTLLGPIIVNILLFHATMQTSGLPMALLFAAFWFLVFARVRSAFAGILQNQVEA